MVPRKPGEESISRRRPSPTGSHDAEWSSKNGGLVIGLAMWVLDEQLSGMLGEKPDWFKREREERNW